MPFSKKQRQIAYDKYNGRCGYCGDEIKIKDMQVDHIIAQMSFLMNVKNRFRVPHFLKHLTEHDIDHIDNAMPACRICNKRKDTCDLELFRSELQDQAKRAAKTSANYRMALKYGQIKETPKPIVFYFERFN